MGQEPGNATFRSLIDKYAKRVQDGDDVDCHFYTQASHLMPIEYNVAICIDNLYPCMSKLLGKEIGDRYFATPANPSRMATTAQNTNGSNLADIPASKLRADWHSHRIPLASQELLDESLAKSIQTIYAEDIEIIKNIKARKR